MTTPRVSAEGLRKVAFMVMPFRVKPVPGAGQPGVPASIDCDALWEKVYDPALTALGYQAIRGDYDPAGVILKEMFERLTWADLVLADVTLPNGNVYYEIGLRHVAKQTACILVAAEWSMPLFDISGMSSIRIPITTSVISDAEAEVARARLMAAIPKLSEVRTPFHELMSADQADEARRRGVFHDQVNAIDAFQTAARAVRLAATMPARQAALARLLEELGDGALELPEVAVELLFLVRDILEWQAVLDFIPRLPPAIRRLGLVEEQRLLALGKVGKAEDAIAGLTTLIATQGATPERRGLLGGRHKSLWRALRTARIAEAERAGTPPPPIPRSRSSGTWSMRSRSTRRG